MATYVALIQPHVTATSLQRPFIPYGLPLRDQSCTTSDFDLTRTHSCGPYFFYVAIYVMTCFLSLAIYMH